MNTKSQVAPSANTNLIPIFSGEIAGKSVQLIDARLLHEFLEVGKDFSNWIKDRIEEYGFTVDQDFLLAKFGEQTKRRGGHNKIDYYLTIDMAKELGMIERNEKGRQIRRYFLEMERIARTQPVQEKLSASECVKTRILICIENGQTSSTIIPAGSCIVDATDPISVRTFISKFVPSNVQMLSALSSAYIEKLMDCQDAAVKIIKKNR
ncbi:MAG: antA/AntB antirepressor family protein [Methylovulum sp.]|nr:antA/AntB antirepressor family protein [Methylovulum sp.]